MDWSRGPNSTHPKLLHPKLAQRPWQGKFWFGKEPMVKSCLDHIPAVCKEGKTNQALLAACPHPQFNKTHIQCELAHCSGDGISDVWTSLCRTFPTPKARPAALQPLTPNFGFILSQFWSMRGWYNKFILVVMLVVLWCPWWPAQVSGVHSAPHTFHTHSRALLCLLWHFQDSFCTFKNLFSRPYPKFIDSPLTLDALHGLGAARLCCLISAACQKCNSCSKPHICTHFTYFLFLHYLRRCFPCLNSLHRDLQRKKRNCIKGNKRFAAIQRQV